MELADLKLILVPTDFSQASESALRTAIGLAQVSGAEVQLFHVDVDPSIEASSGENLFPSTMIFDSVRSETADRLARAMGEVHDAGVRGTTVSRLGRSHTAIVEQARAIGADLIVIGRHARHGFGHSLLGTVAGRVVEHAPCAVLVVAVAEEESAQA